MKILIINGPNLNLLAKRETDHYGNLSLKVINKLLKTKYQQIRFSFFQSNFEGDIITKIQKAINKYDAIIINPAAYTHYSIAIRDALVLFSGLKVEVHLSDINNREDFRKNDLIAPVCDAVFMGQKIDSYLAACAFIVDKTRQKTD